MNLSLYLYQLNFKFPFRIAHGTRTGTDVVYIKLESGNHIGWGEATLPPYLPETQESVVNFCKQFAFENSGNDLDSWLNTLGKVQNNMSAKAALDMALWNLKANIHGKTIAQLFNVSCSEFPLNTYTLGVSDAEEMKLKVAYAIDNGFQLFKIKLNGKNDEDMIRYFRKLSDKEFAVDVNQGWKTVEETVTKIEWLKNEGCVIVEQPLPKSLLSEMREVKLKSVLPVYADESCQRLTDIELLKDCFHGVNIKLMKCGGITEAHQMVLKAGTLGLKILVGCMSESSVGCTAAAHLTPLADFADLDGPYLIGNDPFEGMKIESGRVAVKPLKQNSNFVS